MIPVTDEELLAAVKTRMLIQQTTTELDESIEQHIKTVAMFMQGGGVPDSVIDSNLAVGAIVKGISDLEDEKWSDIFVSMVAQLSACTDE